MSTQNKTENFKLNDEVFVPTMNVDAKVSGFRAGYVQIKWFVKNHICRAELNPELIVKKEKN